MKDEIEFLRSVAEYAPELTKERAITLKKAARHQTDRRALDVLISTFDSQELAIESSEPDIIDSDRLGVLVGGSNEDA